VSSDKKFPESVKPGGHMPAGLPFSEGMRAGDLVFLSGQLGTLPGKLALNNKTAEDEFRQVAYAMAINGR
jgi:2-iminobutanoate/2-iminopropanoate deaminase